MLVEVYDVGLLGADADSVVQGGAREFASLAGSPQRLGSPAQFEEQGPNAVVFHLSHFLGHTENF